MQPIQAIRDHASLDDEVCWRAVLERDAGFDEVFVFAVQSTGIYCRPSCPARRPRRARVRFYALPEAAEQDGFRPCRRCRPHEPPGDPAAGVVERICRYIEAHLDEPLGLADLSAHAGLSPHHLQRTFKRVMGITPRQYRDARRLEAFKARLRDGQDVTAALYEAGYGASSRLYEQAGARLGMTPATYRRGGTGMQIGYTIVDSPLGRLLVAASERGICAVSLGDADAPLEAALRAEYPAAVIERDDSGPGSYVEELVSYLQGQRRQIDLPLDLQASAFQQQVWAALRAIPYGETRSYAAIARALGQPGAARAVGRACATNPVSLVVPCHRAVGEDGGLRGYRWGLERKRALLALEQGE